MLCEMLNFSDVRKMVSLSRSTIFRYERRKLFPARRQLTANRVAWDKDSIVAWIESRPKVGDANN